METTFSPDVLKFSKVSKQKRGPYKTTWKEQAQAQVPDPGRRTVLKLFGLAALGAVLARIPGDSITPTGDLKQELQIPKIDPYRDWKQYKEGILPKDIVLAIGQDLARSSEFPGFSEVGKLIIISQQQPDQLQNYLPQLAGHGPIDIKLTNLQSDGALARMNAHAANMSQVPVLVRDRKTDVSTQGMLNKVGKLTLEIDLDSGVAFAPDIAKKFLIVKEFSHLLYFSPHRQKIEDTVLRNFEVTGPNQVDPANLLLNSAYGGQYIPGIQFGDVYNNARVDLDGAGYWYTLPALAKMKAKKLLSTNDLLIMDANFGLVEDAKRNNLLIDKDNGEFVWREGIGPFSPEWLTILHAKFGLNPYMAKPK